VEHVLDLEGDNIAAAQLAVDGEIEPRQVGFAISDLELGADRPVMLWPKRRLGSHQLTLVPKGTRLDAGGAEVSSFRMVAVAGAALMGTILVGPRLR
jgi:hypothetical protein